MSRYRNGFYGSKRARGEAGMMFWVVVAEGLFLSARSLYRLAAKFLAGRAPGGGNGRIR